MKLGLINSAWAQSGRDTAFGIRKTKEIGFDTIDIFADPLDIDIREKLLIKRECDRAGLPIVSICCVAVGLIDFNPSVARFHLERCRKYLELATEWNARNILLVIGEYIWEQQVIAPKEQWDLGVRQLRQLGQVAADLGREIVLELEPFKLSLIRDVETMLRFLQEVDHPAVRANLDISHLCLSHVSPFEIQKLRGRVGHVHISDCDGKVHGDLPPGRGVVDFPGYLAELKKLNVDGVMSIELEYSPEPEKIVEWVTEAYQATDRLMKEHGLRG